MKTNTFNVLQLKLSVEMGSLILFPNFISIFGNLHFWRSKFGGENSNHFFFHFFVVQSFLVLFVHPGSFGKLPITKFLPQNAGILEISSF